MLINVVEIIWSVNQHKIKKKKRKGDNLLFSEEREIRECLLKN